MSMLKKLKSIFIVEEEVKSSGSSTSSSTKTKSTKSNSESTMAGKKPSKSSSGKPSDKFVNLLLKAIESNNMDGFDYLEFKQSLQSLTNVEPDEGKRFKNAYVMATTMGMTKKTLHDSAQRYTDVLAEEEKKFSEAFVKQKENQVVGRENKIAQLKKSIQEKKKKIAALEKEIAAHEKSLTGIEGEMKEAMSKVEATRDQFYSSYHLVLDQITKDIEKIDKYIDA